MKRVDDFRLKFGKHELVPIMIGGMGVDISTAELSLEAARLGDQFERGVLHFGGFLAVGANVVLQLHQHGHSVEGEAFGQDHLHRPQAPFEHVHLRSPEACVRLLGGRQG